MVGYTKLFGSIIASTIWREPDHVRLVWITMLAAANQHGVVEASVPGLADFARVTVEQCRDALRVLSSPDPDSRTSDHEGRRIEMIEGGFKLLNHAKYRGKLNEDDRREYKRRWTAESRRRSGKPVDTCGQSVDNRGQKSTVSTQAEAEAKAEEERKRAARVSRSSGAALAGMLPRDHLNHICSPNFAWCVPEPVHLKLAAKLAPKYGGDVSLAKDALAAWYPTVWAMLPEGTVLGDAYKFWTPRFDAAFASTVAVSAPAKARGCKHDPPCADETAHTRRYLREMRQGAA